MQALCSDFADLCSDIEDVDLRYDYESVPMRIDSEFSARPYTVNFYSDVEAVKTKLSQIKDNFIECVNNYGRTRLLVSRRSLECSDCILINLQ